ncbi:MAG: hypothetical protein GX799_01000 [Crenarchaeota archaeon]|nr:hypothetical protein [Thermoproteota archaeon]
MERKDAVSLVKEINKECESIRGTSIMLKLPEETDVLSKGYQVHLIMTVDLAKMRCLEVVAGQYGYVVKCIPDRGIVIIYKPEKGKPALPSGGRA